MEIKYIMNEKSEAEIEIDSLTLVEILRHYLSKDSDVEFVAWKRDHPTKPPILRVKTKGKTVKKAIEDAVSAIEKDSKKLLEEFKKSK